MPNDVNVEQPHAGAVNGALPNGSSKTKTIVTHSDGVPAVVEVPAAEAKATTTTVKFLPADFYAPFLSELAKSWSPNPIRGLMPLENRPGMISLLAGKPNVSTFPFTSIALTTKSPTDPSAESIITLSGDVLARGLQYGDTAGLSALLDWFTGLMEFSHGRKKGEGWKVSIGSGSQDVIYKAFHALVNTGDSILTETPAYAGVILIFKVLECNIIDVKTDAYGIDSSSLRSILENWPTSKPRPKVLYTVPYGCNPTGMTATIERRREVLALSKEFNFLILEDDPYYYLYFGTAPRPPSYFELELEMEEVGRVIRFDSLSKILSSGIRIGSVTGPEPVLRAIDLHSATSNLQVSTLTQTIAHALLQAWGYAGFKAHTEIVSQFYRAKRDVFERAMRLHLDGLAEWTPPEAGMFFWFKLLLSAPGAPAAADDSEAVIRTQALARGVLALPGTVFLPGGQKTAYVRAAFSLLDEPDVDEALRRLRAVILDVRSAAA